jgi:hypothetical protein
MKGGKLVAAGLLVLALAAPSCMKYDFSDLKKLKVADTTVIKKHEYKELQPIKPRGFLPLNDTVVKDTVKTYGDSLPAVPNKERSFLEASKE